MGMIWVHGMFLVLGTLFLWSGIVSGSGLLPGMANGYARGKCPAGYWAAIAFWVFIVLLCVRLIQLDVAALAVA